MSKACAIHRGMKVSVACFTDGMLISTLAWLQEKFVIQARMSRADHIPYETTILVRDSCLCLHVQRAARALARRFDQALRPLGLTNGQFSLLMSLNRPEPPATGAVASLLAMDRTTVTAAVKPLQRRGLLYITTDSNDRRARLLELTPKGRRLLARAVPVWVSAHAEVEARLGEGEANHLRKNLRAFF